jgi:hypothetical protein
VNGKNLFPGFTKKAKEVYPSKIHTEYGVIVFLPGHYDGMKYKA